MFALLIAWAVALPIDPLQLLPPNTENAALVRGGEDLDDALAAFCAKGHQRTVATLMAQLKERSRREFGFNVLSRKERAALGAEAEGFWGVLGMPGAEGPVLALGKTEPGALSTGLREALGSRYARTTLKAVTVRGRALCALTVGDVVTPRVYWANVAGLSYLAGPRGKEALAAVVLALEKTHLGSSPASEVSLQAVWPRAALAPLADHSITWLQRKKSTGPERWHVGGLNVSPSGLEVRSTEQADPMAPAWCSAPATAAARHEALAAGLAERLDHGALAQIHGASLAAFATVHGQINPNANVHAADTLLGPQASALVARLLRHGPALAEALRGIELPFAAAAYSRPHPPQGAPLRDRAEVVLVAHGALPAERALIKTLAQRLQAKAIATNKAPKRPVRVANKPGLSVHLESPAPGWDIAASEDTLMITTSSFSQQAVLEALNHWRPPHPLTGVGGPTPQSRVPVAATLALSALADAAQAVILTGAQEAISSHPLAQAMPQLLLLGPTGDLLREVRALGTLEAFLRCEGTTLWRTARITLGPDDGPPGAPP